MNAQRDALPGGHLEAEALASEKLLLRAACQGLTEDVGDEAQRLLAAHRFGDSIHQVIFESLRALTANHSAITQHELLARLTNRGFPDVDLTPFFEPLKLSREQVAVLIRTVCSEGRETG